MGGTRQDGSKPEIGINLYNFVGGGGCQAEFSGEPRLGSLEDNGGWSETHALLPESPILDLVPAPYCILSVDQIGNPRPAPGDAAQMCDPGAVEFQP